MQFLIHVILKKNKYKYKIIYKNKIYAIQSIFKILDINNNILKIKLICYNNISDILKLSKDLKSYIYYEIKKFKKYIYMYPIINYLFYFSHEILKLVYKIDKNIDEVKIVGEEFVGNNINKCSIIYKDKIIPFQSYILFDDIVKEDKENGKFEIILLELENISDRSYMFENFESLVEVSIINGDIKNNSIKERKNMILENKNKFKDFYYDSKNEFTTIENNNNITNSSYLFEFLISKFNKIKGNVNIKCLHFMFSGCSELISLPDISNWNINNVTNMNNIFSGCTSLISLPDISKWKTNKVINMNKMLFYLIYLNGKLIK